jgi:glutathione S-transferase
MNDMNASALPAGTYRLIGGNGSPYSQKLRAIMRYRRLPHIWEHRTERNLAELAAVRPALIPILQYLEDGSMHIDTTPVAYDLERRHPGARSILPDDPAHAFLSHLIEDMADEWLTKAMFHYRWAYDADIHYASYWIADDFFPDRTGPARDEAARGFAERQIGRMALVGCTPENAPVIETSYRRILNLLEGHVGMFSFLFGSRPALADFGLFGQLKTLATDPTPMAIMRAEAQRTESWVRQLDDASGIDGEWLAADSALPQATLGLVSLCAEVYLPFLKANAEAVESGADSFDLELMGQRYGQGAFPYQAKCLAELRQRYAALADGARSTVDEAVGQTGAAILGLPAA